MIKLKIIPASFFFNTRQGHFGPDNPDIFQI
jgi:hypothetical protein